MTEALVSLPNFAQLSSRVWRVLGLNPGKFTLQGTNTYLVGAGLQKILIDCGEGKADYVGLLQQSLERIHPEAYITDILISHEHEDHWGGLEQILQSSELNAKNAIRVHKHPTHPIPIKTEPLQDGQVFRLEDDDSTIEVIHTPGHTADHCAFYLKEENRLFTADCVLGQGTAVFEDLADYLEGLKGLLRFKADELYPGHGPVVKGEKIQEYIDHRLAREGQIVDVLKRGPVSPIEIVQVLYEGYPDSLHLPAAHGVVLHLVKLRKEGKVWSESDLPLLKENFQAILNGKWSWVGRSGL